MVLQEDVEPQQQEESGPYEEVYKDSSTFLKVDLNTIIYDLHNNYILVRWKFVQKSYIMLITVKSKFMIPGFLGGFFCGIYSFLHLLGHIF